MSLAGRLIVMTAKRSARRFQRSSMDPVAVQRNLLMSLLRRNAGTEYGRRYGFNAIGSIEAYQRQVPVVSYDDIRQDMERVVNEGARNVFTAEDPVMFAQTSGTTGTPKFVPVTPSCQGQVHSDQMRTWIYHAASDHRGMFAGKVVSLVSPAVEGHTPTGLPYGSTSGHIYKHMPRIVQTAYSVPYPVFEIEDYEAKYYAVLRVALEDNITFVATANPSSIIKLCEKGQEFAADLIRDIRDGTLRRDLPISAGIRNLLTRRCRPNPARAAELEKLLARRNGRLLPGDYWPNIALIGCWKGGTVGHYLDRFDDWFRPDGGAGVPVRDWGFLSSEARCSIPLSDEGSCGALTVSANFFEFAPVDEVAANPDDPSAWRCRTVADVEEGAEYHILFSTTGGLYRYDINDVVQVQGRYNGIPQIRFLRKGRGMTNITGEKLSVNQVIDAFQAVERDTGLLVDHFKAEADVTGARYVFKVEFTRAVDDRQARGFLEGLDQRLRHSNIEYKAKRDSMRLVAPRLHMMREGWYERARREQVSEGKRMFQAKTDLLSPVLADTAQIRPELLGVVDMVDESPDRSGCEQ